ncbi:DUF3907 family protein [Peribacillus loiseleuriae]|uniref:DUF3907 family protein n=1 Tax=Peribacillus loiseleuriae TaxID=1679170 RepID=UPI003D092328
MDNTMIQSQLVDVRNFLEITISELETYLNETTIHELKQEKQGDETYYKGLLSTIRRLLVNSEYCLEECQIILKNTTFHKAAAEKTLYQIFHGCVEEFFTPRSDVWYEDSRSAYTGAHAIRFQKEAPDSVDRLLKNLEGSFQRIREELEFYETDYRTKMTQSN